AASGGGAGRRALLLHRSRRAESPQPARPHTDARSAPCSSRSNCSATSTSTCAGDPRRARAALRMSARGESTRCSSQAVRASTPTTEPSPTGTSSTPQTDMSGLYPAPSVSNPSRNRTDDREPQELFLRDVLHKALVSVDEHGLKQPVQTAAGDGSGHRAPSIG